MPQGRRRVRIVRNSVLVEDYFTTLGPGQRFEILRLLSNGPLCVSRITEALFQQMSAVSRDLAQLEELGLVVCRRIKTSRIYSLSERVRVFRQGTIVEIQVLMAAGLWMLLHIDDAAPEQDLSPAPKSFTS